MLHFGHSSPGLVDVTSECIGHTYTVASDPAPDALALAEWTA